MGLHENKAVVQRLFDAINNGRLDELPQVVAPDVVDHNAVIFMQPEGAMAPGERARVWPRLAVVLLQAPAVPTSATTTATST